MATLNNPIAVLRETAPQPSRGVALAARRTRFTAWGWRCALWLAQQLGRFIRWFVIEGRALVVAVLAIVAFVLMRKGLDWEAGGAALACALLIIGPPILSARGRVMVGDFSGLPPGPGGDNLRPAVDIGNLLQTELSRLGSLLRVVEDRRAVSSGLVSSNALDATISVDQVVGALQDTVSAETKVSIGPISVPVAPLMALAGRAFRAPRLTGSLHRDGETLILTARQRGHSGLSWQVSAVATGEGAELSGMVRELALRIFTDLALGRDVRWEATDNFVRGLERFRAALRTPKDRKVNLRGAQHEFLDALSQDEDFPVGYYNLGVVYTELHGLAVNGGRKQEELMHLNAAETSFKWAIEKEPQRWDTYLALAQTQFADDRYDDVITHCRRILRVRRPWNLSARARARDLRARALVMRDRSGDVKRAVRNARKATHGALWALMFARLFRHTAPRGEGDRVPRCEELAGSCVATYALCFSKLMPAGQTTAVPNRVRSLLSMAEALLGSISDVHFEFGLRALSRGNFPLATDELEAARQSDPKRSAYIAARALLLLRQERAKLEPGTELPEFLVEDVEQLCDEAVEGMAGVFAPSRDLHACKLVIKVYEELAVATQSDDASDRASQLRKASQEVELRLDTPAGEASVSAFFLEELQNVEWTAELGAYGIATREARAILNNGEPRDALKPAERATSLNPLSSLAWETLGDVHSELQDFRSAREAWEYARSRDPDNPRLYDKIGSSHWQIAFDEHTGVNREELERAGGYFDRALLLYGSGSLDEQSLTRYRLGKLYTALGDFANALPQLKIVEAVSDKPPIVGWQLLAQAQLRERNFAECEHYFRRVTTAADVLDPDGLTATQVIGHHIDERLWPLGFVRAWGHLGLALSFVERDGNLDDASEQLRLARSHADRVEDRQRFPTRIDAACLDCEGFVCQRRRDVEEAITKLEEAVGAFPYSRAYLHLASAYVDRARRTAVAQRDDDLEAAGRALGHAVSLRPSDLPTDEVDNVRRELELLASPMG